MITKIEEKAAIAHPEDVTGLISKITELPSEISEQLATIAMNWIQKWPDRPSIAKCRLPLVSDSSEYPLARGSISMEMKSQEYGKELKLNLNLKNFGGKSARHVIKFIS